MLYKHGVWTKQLYFQVTEVSMETYLLTRWLSTRVTYDHLCVDTLNQETWCCPVPNWNFVRGNFTHSNIFCEPLDSKYIHIYSPTLFCDYNCTSCWRCFTWINWKQFQIVRIRLIQVTGRMENFQITKRWKYILILFPGYQNRMCVFTQHMS